MPLNFLGDLSGFVGGATPVMQGIGSLLNAFGVGKPKIKYGPTPSEAQANSLFQALLDPNNSLVKQNTDINMQKGMQDLLAQLKLMQMQGQRQEARGVRNTFFNPERADETINYLLTRGQPAIVEKARDRARNDIAYTAESLLKFQPYEQQRINDMNLNRQNAYDTIQGKGGLGGMAGAFGGGLRDLLWVLQGNSPRVTAEGPLPWLNGGRV